MKNKIEDKINSLLKEIVMLERELDVEFECYGKDLIQYAEGQIISKKQMIEFLKELVEGGEKLSKNIINEVSEQIGVDIGELFNTQEETKENKEAKEKMEENQFDIYEEQERDNK